VSVRRAVIFVMALCAPFGIASSEDTGTLRVVATGIENRPGKIVIRLYGSADHWLEPEGALRTVVIDPSADAVGVFENVPGGRYAVSVVHDENGNQKMDLGLFPLPHVLEGGGVSNDVRPKLGPPRFADAVFEFRPPEQSITITLRY
jgi:uncharacterized protein (DUF2141 family)